SLAVGDPLAVAHDGAPAFVPRSSPREPLDGGGGVRRHRPVRDPARDRAAGVEPGSTARADRDRHDGASLLVDHAGAGCFFLPFRARPGRIRCPGPLHGHRLRPSEGRLLARRWNEYTTVRPYLARPGRRAWAGLLVPD